MKKVLVVLLIAVLAIGSVFATVSGNVTAGYKFDFTNETAAYNLGGAYSKISFTYATDKGTSTGENKPYATATVNLAIGSGYFGGKYDSTAFNWGWNKSSGVTQTVTPSVSSKFTLSDFRIVGENWEVNLLKATMFGDYAKSAWETYARLYEENSTYAWKDIAFTFANVPDARKGVTVSYDDYKVGIYASSTSTSTEFGISSQTKAIEFDGGSAQAAVDFGYAKTSSSDATLTFAGSVKADYEVSDVALAVAADTYAAKDVFDFDVSATASYKPVVLDFYYASELTLPDATSVTYYLPEYSDTENILSVRAQFDVAELAEDVKVKLTARAENLLNDAKILSAEAEVTAIENLDLTVGFNDMLKKGYDLQYLFGEAEYTGIENVTLSANAGYSFGGKWFDAGVKAEYAAEKFTVVAAGALYAEDGADTALAGRVGISSTTIVDNATIGADLVFNEKALFSSYSVLNYLNTYVKVAF